MGAGQSPLISLLFGFGFKMLRRKAICWIYSSLSCSRFTLFIQISNGSNHRCLFLILHLLMVTNLLFLVEKSYLWKFNLC